MNAPIRPEQDSEHIDDRLLFLVRAHARLILVEADEMTFDEALRDWSSPFATASAGRWRRNGNALTRTAVITAVAGGEHEPRSSSLSAALA